MACINAENCSVDGVARECYSEDFLDRNNPDTISTENLLNVSFCGCSSWYGFTGITCAEYGVQVGYFLAGLTFFSLVGALLSILLVKDILLYLRTVRGQAWGNKPLLLSSLLTLFASIFTMLRSVIQIPTLLDSKQFIVEDFFFDDDIVNTRHGYYADMLLELANSFVLLSVVVIAASWLKIANTLAEYQVSSLKKSMDRFKNFFLWVAIIYSVLSFFGFVYSPFSRIWLLTPFLCVLFALFIWSADRKFRRSITVLSGKQIASFQSPIKLVRRSTKITCWCLMGFGTSTILYVVLVITVSATIQPGDINYIVMTRDSAILFLCLQLICNRWYLKNIMRTLMKYHKNYEFRKPNNNSKTSTKHQRKQFAKHRKPRMRIPSKTSEKKPSMEHLKIETVNSAEGETVNCDEEMESKKVTLKEKDLSIKIHVSL